MSMQPTKILEADGTTSVRMFVRDAYDVLVTEDSTVRVWDHVAGHWTLTHSLPDGLAEACIRVAHDTRRAVYAVERWTGASWECVEGGMSEEDATHAAERWVAEQCERASVAKYMPDEGSSAVSRVEVSR